MNSLDKAVTLGAGIGLLLSIIGVIGLGRRFKNTKIQESLPQATARIGYRWQRGAIVLPSVVYCSCIVASFTAKGLEGCITAVFIVLVAMLSLVSVWLQTWWALEDIENPPCEDARLHALADSMRSDQWNRWMPTIAFVLYIVAAIVGAWISNHPVNEILSLLANGDGILGMLFGIVITLLMFGQIGSGVRAWLKRPWMLKKNKNVYEALKERREKLDNEALVHGDMNG